jgi:hypothetical protein
VLWPEQPPAAADSSLSAVLSKLRRALGDGVLPGRGEQRVRFDGDVVIDIEAAEAAVARAEAAIEAALPSHPQMTFAGPLVSFTLESAERAQAFLDASALVTEATSFGGVHSTAERRARWGTDDVPEGFIRFSAGCEDTADLVADVAHALDATG